MVCAVGDGAKYNDQKEQEVMAIAAAALANQGNCFLVGSCKSDCSRAVCRPQKEDLQDSLCTKVDNNEYCPLSNSVSNASQGCQQMMLNYKKSYITLPPNTDFQNLPTEITRDVCLQRALDSTFKTISFPDNFSYVYFGSVSGAWRAFPGRDSTEERCNSFDSRWRPWFLDAISVSKQLMILVDTGNMMGTSVTGEFQRPLGTTYLDIGIDLAVSLIQTLSPGDFVQVWPFNSSGASPLGPAINVGNYDDSGARSELMPLKDSVKRLKRSDDPRPSDLNDGVIKAVSSFKTTGSNSLKLVVVISNGNFIPLNTTTFPTAVIRQNKTKLLVYKLPVNSDSDPTSDPFLINTTLPSVLCGVQGSFEVLEAPATANPLYALRGYFSFLAQTHQDAVNSKPTWSNVYRSVAQSLDAVTVTAPAIDKDGRLVGVSGIDVYLNQLEGQLRALVVSDLASRRRGTIQPPNNLTLVCSYQNQSTVAAVCPSSSLPSDGVTCPKTDTRNLAERVCCGNCVPPPPPPFAWWKILLIFVGGSIGVFLLVWACGNCYYGSNKKFKQAVKSRFACCFCWRTKALPGADVGGLKTPAQVASVSVTQCSIRSK